MVGIAIVDIVIPAVNIVPPRPKPNPVLDEQRASPKRPNTTAGTPARLVTRVCIVDCK